MIKKLKQTIEEQKAGNKTKQAALKNFGKQILGNFNEQLEDYIHF